MCPIQYALFGFCHGYPRNDFTYLLLYCGELKLHLCLVDLGWLSSFKFAKISFPFVMRIGNTFDLFTLWIFVNLCLKLWMNFSVIYFQSQENPIFYSSLETQDTHELDSKWALIVGLIQGLNDSKFNCFTKWIRKWSLRPNCLPGSCSNMWASLGLNKRWIRIRIELFCFLNFGIILIDVEKVLIDFASKVLFIVDKGTQRCRLNEDKIL